MPNVKPKGICFHQSFIICKNSILALRDYFIDYHFTTFISNPLQILILYFICRYYFCFAFCYFYYNIDIVNIIFDYSLSFDHENFSNFKFFKSFIAVWCIYLVKFNRWFNYMNFSVLSLISILELYLLVQLRNPFLSFQHK